MWDEEAQASGGRVWNQKRHSYQMGPTEGGADMWETAEEEETLNPRRNGQVEPSEDHSKEQCSSAQGSVRAELMIIQPSLYRALSTICAWMASLCLYLPQREFLCLY